MVQKIQTTEANIPRLSPMLHVVSFFSSPVTTLVPTCS